MARKRRSDRYHLIYQLTAPSGEKYIGVTFMRGDSRSMKARKKSAESRYKAHCRNAMEYGHETVLCKTLREVGVENVKREVLEVIRGKKEVHARERELIAKLSPELNMEGMGRKVNSLRKAS